MKVSVLGAGPAGSTAAYYLAEAGIEVELIDRRAFPRDKPCAGGLFNPLLYEREFPHLGEISGKEVYRVHFSSGRYSFQWTSDEPLVKTVLRSEFDHALLRRAQRAGARFLLNQEPGGDVLIDATGALSWENYREAGICLVNDFKTDREIDTVYIHHCFGGIKGYAWLFPKKGTSTWESARIFRSRASGICTSATWTCYAIGAYSTNQDIPAAPGSFPSLRSTGFTRGTGSSQVTRPVSSNLQTARVSISPCSPGRSPLEPSSEITICHGTSADAGSPSEDTSDRSGSTGANHCS
jgi:hypothetical protein